MASNPVSDYLPAIQAVQQAGVLCQRVQASLVTAETLEKKDRSPVTVADFGSQAVICRALRQAYPDLEIVAEEDAAELREEGNAAVLAQVVEQVRGLGLDLDTSAVLDAIDLGNHDASAGRYWTLDPIDGTKGFLRGEQYAVALGLIENGEVVLGILGCPNLPHENGQGCLFLARKGQGAAWAPLSELSNLKPVKADAVTDVTQARFCESVESGHSSHSDSAKIAEMLGVSGEPFRIDSQCKYAAVARGDASIYLRLPTRKGYEEKIWDHAAGMLVIEEAGGRVSDVRGNPLDFGQGKTLKKNAGVVATSAAIHDQVVAAVKAVLGT